MNASSESRSENQGMMNRFEGKVALVSGAASGIGRAAAIRIANEGGSVVCIDLQREAVEATAKEICENGGSALALTCDVSDAASVREAVAAGVKQYGRLDALCNAAGILRFDDTLELAVEDWERVLAVNLTGTFLMCQAALPHLIETNGHIVNITSTSALAGQPWSAAYGASKGGVLALTRTLGATSAARFRVNTLPAALKVA